MGLVAAEMLCFLEELLALYWVSFVLMKRKEVQNINQIRGFERAYLY